MNTKHNEKQKSIDELVTAFRKEEVLREQADAIGYVVGFLMNFAGEYEREKGQSLVDGITWRIKDAESIRQKLMKKKLTVSYENAVLHLNDLCGVRVVCPFRDDVYRIAEAVKASPSFRVIKVKDYIKHPKQSGYQSLHLIVELLQMPDAKQKKVEIQIRSLAMNFWAKLDHRLCYKNVKLQKNKALLQQELSAIAARIDEIDQKMVLLRNYYAEK